MQAILDRVLIRRDAYAGQIITQHKLCTGIVVSVGPGIWRGSMDDVEGLKERKLKEHFYRTTLKAGDRVCFSLDKGEEHDIEGEKIVVMREWDIAGVIEHEEAQDAA